jgi:PAT family beta-lactamase induction signal transducer AmpG
MRVDRQIGWWDALSVYLTRRQIIILVMGFASGLPRLLTLSTLSYWLTKVGVDKTTIGLFALVGIPYTLKFAWSPIIDHLRLPLIWRLGRRKSWLLLCQVGLVIVIFLMGRADPTVDPALTAILAIFVAFFSASQDIVIDAYRIEILGEVEQGAGAGTTQVGYRLGMLLAGAGATAMSDYIDWPTIFAALAFAAASCAAFTLFVPEPSVRPDSNAKQKSYLDWFQDAVIQPFADFMGRRGWIVILLFVALYKYGDAFGGAMANPFYVELGFTGTEIALMSKIYGVIATLAGGVLGGLIVVRYGLFRTLLAGGVLQALTNLLFGYLALQGNDLVWLGVAITADNLAGGVASAALVAYLSGLCNVAFTATQYALFSSFMALGTTVLSSGSGWVADHLDWPIFWGLTTLMAIPGVLLLFWIARLYPQGLTQKQR